MKLKDVKILWGRAANRCSFPKCKLELTPDGKSNTLGEIAHIVAESLDGPRGTSDLPLEQRDDYSNLMLLCPTHHKMIDTYPDEWTIEKLKSIKSEHEKWVSIQLDEKRISINNIDNSDFMASREEHWVEFAEHYVWVISSITPLQISEDAIDPLKPEIIGFINDVKVTKSHVLNSYYTRPNEYGVINEDLRMLQDGIGHQFQLFRSGHSEFLICIEDSTRRITEVMYRESGEKNPNRIIRYTSLAHAIYREITNLKDIWTKCLPFNDMLVTTLVTNTKSTIMYSSEDEWGGALLGSKINSPTLKYVTVCNKDASAIKLS